MDEIVSLMKFSFAKLENTINPIAQMKQYGENSVLQKFRTAKIPYGEISVMQKILTVKISYGENSEGRETHAAKIPAT